MLKDTPLKDRGHVLGSQDTMSYFPKDVTVHKEDSPQGSLGLRVLKFMLHSVTHFQKLQTGPPGSHSTKSRLQRRALVGNGSGTCRSPAAIYIQRKRWTPSLGNAAEMGKHGVPTVPTQAAAVLQGMDENTSWSARCPSGQCQTHAQLCKHVGRRDLH